VLEAEFLNFFLYEGYYLFVAPRVHATLVSFPYLNPVVETKSSSPELDSIKIRGKLLAGGKFKDRTWQNLERPLSTEEKSAFYNIFEEYYASYVHFWLEKFSKNILERHLYHILIYGFGKTGWPDDYWCLLPMALLKIILFSIPTCLAQSNNYITLRSLKHSF
jgi:hypothetical protein